MVEGLRHRAQEQGLLCNENKKTTQRDKPCHRPPSPSVPSTSRPSNVATGSEKNIPLACDPQGFGFPPRAVRKPRTNLPSDLGGAKERRGESWKILPRPGRAGREAVAVSLHSL